MASKKPKKFFKQLKSNFIRKDLVRLIDVEFPSLLTVEQMPRYTISANEGQFQKLFSLLSIDDEETSRDVWDLVRMLATNENMYQ